MNITAGHTIFDFVLWLTYSCDGGTDDTDIDYGSDELHTRIGSKFLAADSSSIYPNVVCCLFACFSVVFKLENC